MSKRLIMLEHLIVVTLLPVCSIEIPEKICGFDRDCFVASLLAMTYTSIACHCEERSDEAISKPQLFCEGSIVFSNVFQGVSVEKRSVERTASVPWRQVVKTWVYNKDCRGRGR